MRPCEYLFVVDEFWPIESAPAVRIHSLISVLDEQSCGVLAGAFELPPHPAEGWHLLPRGRSSHPLKVLAFILKLLLTLLWAALCRKCRVVVISVPKYELLLAVPLLRLLGVKIVIDVRDTLEFLDYDSYLARYMPAFLARPLSALARCFSGYLRHGSFAHADLVTAANQAIVDSLKGLNSRVELVSNGVDTSHFKPQDLERPPLPPLELVYMGNFVEKDDFSVLAEAAGGLQGRLRVNLIGQGRHKPSILALLKDRVDVRDFGRLTHADIPGVLSGMHAGFIFRSEAVSASIPVALYEFVSMNLPVICNDTGIMGEFVRRHELGWVLDTAEELKACLADLLAQPAKLAESDRLHRYADQHFSRQAAARKFKIALMNL